MAETLTAMVIREKLEKTGELGKMRAMVVDAAIKAISKEGTVSNLFMPTSSLKGAKDHPDGRRALSVLVDYLEYLGLTYTLSVLKHEASLIDITLESTESVSRALGFPESNDPLLKRLLEVTSASDGAGASAEAVPLAPVMAVPKDIPVSTPDTPAAIVNLSEQKGEDTTYFISKWTKKQFYRCDGLVSGQQVQIEYLKDCDTYVLDPLDSMTVDDCEGGELIIAACEGSVFLRNCKNMTVHVACKQLRTRDCEGLALCLFASTDPVIESSHHITVKPFHLRLPGLKSSFKAARLDPKNNRFVHVYDFTEDDATLPQPHFTVAYPVHSLRMTDRCQEKGIPECPPEIVDLVEGRLAPAMSSESGQNKSYNIKTGADKWAKTETSSVSEDHGSNSPEISKNPSPSRDARLPLAAPAVNTNQVIGSANRDDNSYSSFEDDDDDDDCDDNDHDAMDVDEDDDDF